MSLSIVVRVGPIIGDENKNPRKIMQIEKRFVGVIIKTNLRWNFSSFSETVAIVWERCVSDWFGH